MLQNFGKAKIQFITLLKNRNMLYCWRLKSLTAAHCMQRGTLYGFRISLTINYKISRAPLSDALLTTENIYAVLNLLQINHLNIETSCIWPRLQHFKG